MCPHDPGHYVPKGAMEKHLKYCQWLKKGYTKKELVRNVGTDLLGVKEGAMLFWVVESENMASCHFPLFVIEMFSSK